MVVRGVCQQMGRTRLLLGSSVAAQQLLVSSVKSVKSRENVERVTWGSGVVRDEEPSDHTLSLQWRVFHPTMTPAVP